MPIKDQKVACILYRFKMKIPILILQGTTDIQVSVEDAGCPIEELEQSLTGKSEHPVAE